MEGTTSPSGARTAALVDELRSQQRVLARAQAHSAELMVEFAEARRTMDEYLIADRKAAGGDARFKAGEFAAREISMAVKGSKYTVQRTAAMAHRLKTESPDTSDAWQVGDIDQDKAIRINRALRRLVFDKSKQLLNTVVVDVATQRTPEILDRWLNQFIAQVEPDQTDERLRRSLEDRYVSVRPDIDGVSFLSAAMSSVDATAVDQVLTALAAAAGPGDLRTQQQRRADALVDVLLGRVSNGCHVTWDTNDDADDHLDDGANDRDDANHRDDNTCVVTDRDPNGAVTRDPAANPDRALAGEDWDAHDWELPASAFRPDPLAPPSDAPAPPKPIGSARVTACPGTGQPRPLPVTIGVVVSIQSLCGYSNNPGQLIDRSCLVPADTIRDLAAQPGTLFYRLLTDETGNLLDVTEMGRFPSRKLGLTAAGRNLPRPALSLALACLEPDILLVIRRRAPTRLRYGRAGSEPGRRPRPPAGWPAESTRPPRRARWSGSRRRG